MLKWNEIFCLQKTLNVLESLKPHGILSEDEMKLIPELKILINKFSKQALGLEGVKKHWTRKLTQP